MPRWWWSWSIFIKCKWEKLLSEFLNLSSDIVFDACDNYGNNNWVISCESIFNTVYGKFHSRQCNMSANAFSTIDSAGEIPIHILFPDPNSTRLNLFPRYSISLASLRKLSGWNFNGFSGWSGSLCIARTSRENLEPFRNRVQVTLDLAGQGVQCNHSVRFSGGGVFFFLGNERSHLYSLDNKLGTSN